MLYGNLVAKKGGLLDDAILDKTDPYVLMDEKAKAFVPQGLKTADAIPLVIDFKDQIKAENLSFIKSFSEEVKAAFPEFGVLSLSIVPNYRDNGQELINKPYIDNELLNKIRYNPDIIADWIGEVKKDASVYGLLIGKNLDYAPVVILLPRDYDEIGTFRKVAEFLEQRQIPWYEWYLKTDIYPVEKYKNISVAGWAMARGLMDAALIADIMKLSSIGLVLVCAAFYLSLRSKRQALIASFIILICFLWIRGSIGLFQLLGIGIYERVYSLLIYTAVIVSGISFAERKFDSYNELRQEFPELSRSEVWKKTSAAVNGMIGVTALIAILNFGTLYQIGIRGILEVGVLAALGTIYLLILVLWFMPALHTLVGGEAVMVPSASRLDKLTYLWDELLNKIVRICYRMIDSNPPKDYNYKRKAYQAVGLTTMTALLAILVIALDYVPFIQKDFSFLEVRTKPLDYLPGTIVYKSSEILNRPGNYGFDRLSFLAMAPNGGDINNPDFISRVDKLRQGIAELKNIREVNSVIDITRVIARESYKTDLPQNNRQIHDSLQMIEWDLGSLIKEQFWFNHGIVLFASFLGNDSNIVGEVIQDVINLSKEKFPDLAVLPFGKVITYPQADQYIREGKPWNVFSSQWIVVVVCALWIIWRNYYYLHHLKVIIRLAAWRTGLIISMPFVFASAVIALVMVIFRVPLDQATACITAMAINAAIDFSLYLVADYQTALLDGKDLRGSLHYALVSKGKIIVVDIVLNALCFAPLITSTFIPVARLGWVMVVMMLSCGFGSLVLLPALLPWCVKDVPSTNYPLKGAIL